MTTTDNTSNAKRPCACGVQGPHYPRPLGAALGRRAITATAIGALFSCVGAEGAAAEAEDKRVFRALGVPYTPDTDPQDYDMEGGVTAAAIEKEAEPPAYTAEDFARAEFARHPDGGIAARVDPAGACPWAVPHEPTSLSKWRADRSMAEDGWVPVQESRAAVADAALAQMAKDFRVVRAQRDDAGKRARMAEKERNDARYGMEVATQQRNNWESIARQAIAEQPRPLTPDAITDELVERAWNRWLDLDPMDMHSMRLALRAAVTEPSARPDGAEEIQAVIDDLFTFSDEDGGPDAAVDLANRMAERGVRVAGSET